MAIRAAVLKRGKVDNIIVLASENDAPTFNAIPLTEETKHVSFGWSYDEANKAWIAPPPLPPAPKTYSDLENETVKRLASGVHYDFGDDRGMHLFGTTPPDMNGWNEVNTIANIHMNKGNGGATINIVTDTGPVTVSANEWQDVFLAIHEHRQQVWAKSFALEAMDSLPQDLEDDKHWT